MDQVLLIHTVIVMVTKEIVQEFVVEKLIEMNVVSVMVMDTIKQNSVIVIKNIGIVQYLQSVVDHSELIHAEYVMDVVLLLLSVIVMVIKKIVLENVEVILKKTYVEHVTDQVFLMENVIVIIIKKIACMFVTEEKK